MGTGLTAKSGVIRCAVETKVYLSHNWFVAATQMASSTDKHKVATTSFTRIAVGLILGLACFVAVQTGGIFVGQTTGKALNTFQTILPVESDPLRSVGGANQASTSALSSAL